MTKNHRLQVIRRGELELGKPLPYAVYDADRNLLLGRGVEVSSARQLEALLERGLYRTSSQSLPGQRSVSGPGQRSAEGMEPAETCALPPRAEDRNFQDVKFSLGDTLQLQPQLEGAPERFNVHVIGFVKSKSLLVSAPLAEGKLVFVRDGQTFMVRAFSGLNVYAFRARALKYQYSPFPYLHLSYPKRIDGKRIRKALRAPVSIIVSVHENAEGRQVGAGKIVDISVGGARMLSQTSFGERDQSFWLSFKVCLGEMEEYVKTQATIRAKGEDLDDDGQAKISYGFEFGALNQTEKLIIMNLVYQRVFMEDGG